MASAQFQIDPGTGTYGPAGEAQDAAGGATVNCRLVSTVGVEPGLIEWTIFGTHSPSVPAGSITINLSGNPTGQIASFTLPAGQTQAYGVRCKVNGGQDVTDDAATTSTSAVYVLDGNGNRPFFVNETFESDATHGPVPRLNAIMSAGSSTVADYKGSVRVATAAALPANTRSGNVLTASANGALPTIDGVALAQGERVLVKDEVTGANNGIFDATDLGSGTTPWVLTRSTDADTSGEVNPGLLVPVEEGSVNADALFMLTTNAPITLNTTGLTFSNYGVLSPLVSASARGTVSQLGAADTVLTTDGSTAGGAWAKIADANIAAAAAVAITKLAAGSAGQVLVTSGTTPTWATVVDGNVNASAAIAGTKISPDFGAQNIVTTGFISLGADPATAGAIRLSNADAINWQSSPAGTNIRALLVDSFETLYLGNSGASGTVDNVYDVSTGGQHHFRVNNVDQLLISATTLDAKDNAILTTGHVAVGAAPAASGALRGVNNVTVVAARNAAGSADLDLVATDTSDRALFGNGSGVTRVLASASGVELYASGSRRLLISSTLIQPDVNSISWLSTATPTITQQDNTGASATAATFTLQAGNATGTTSTGGLLSLRSGTGTSADGDVEIRRGATLAVQFDANAASFSDATPLRLGTTNTAGSGDLRGRNNRVLLAARNAAATADLELVKTDGADLATFGNASGDTNVDAGVTAQIRTAGTSRVTVSASLFQITMALARFSSTVVNPRLYQMDDTAANATGDLWAINAQDVTGSGTSVTGGALTVRAGDAGSATATARVGGKLLLRSGTGLTATTAGDVEIQRGTTNYATFTESGGEGRVVLGDTVSTITIGKSFAANITHANRTTGNGSALELKAQSTGSGIGGDLLLTAGAGASTGAGGNVVIAGGAAAGTTETGGKVQIKAGAKVGASTSEVEFFVNSTVAAMNLRHSTGGAVQWSVFGVTPASRAAAYTRNATIVEDRTLLASSSATVTNNNNVLAALIADLQAYGLLQ